MKKVSGPTAVTEVGDIGSFFEKALEQKASETTTLSQEKLAPSQVFVTRQFRESGKDVGEPKQTDEQIEVHRFITEPAKVHVDLGLTLNLGNYESAKISVGVVVPCYKEEIEEAFRFARAFAQDRVQAEASEARTSQAELPKAGAGIF